MENKLLLWVARVRPDRRTCSWRTHCRVSWLEGRGRRPICTRGYSAQLRRCMFAIIALLVLKVVRFQYRPFCYLWLSKFR